LGAHLLTKKAEAFTEHCLTNGFLHIYNFMKILFAFICLAFFKTTVAQKTTNAFFFSEVGWSIHLPADFELLDSAANATIQHLGKEEIEGAIDGKIHVLKTINLISAKKSFNYFNATLTPFDPQKDGRMDAFIQSQKEIVYTSMAAATKVDSSSTQAIIGSLAFDRFTMTVHVDEKLSFNMVLSSRFYKGYYFAIVYVYMNKETEQQIETMLTSSKFS
jgi:hypothetical protein